MDDRLFVYATAAVIFCYLAASIIRKAFDPFAPVWMFVLGYFQIYVVQATTYREYALRVRGVEITTLANSRALWAICWFLLIYSLPIGRVVARKLPKAPSSWSRGLLVPVVPLLAAWGLIGALFLAQDIDKPITEVSQETFLFLQFPMMLLVAAILLIVTGRDVNRPNPMLAFAGLGLALLYIAIWMFNGKRSHPLFGLLTTICVWYCSKGKRPSLPVLGGVALAGAVALTLAIGWRNNPKYERTPVGFVQYISEFNPTEILYNTNVAARGDDGGDAKKNISYETEEYGAYLLMLDTVPMKSSHDYGASYMRLWSTFIPRIVWPNKPFYGREEWVSAWIAGSEFKRDTTFTGPAIGILGATHLNGDAPATLIVFAALAILLKTGYSYFLQYRTSPWAQAWWALTFYNAWLMTVNDDPFVWFYYIYGFTILPVMGFLWIYNKLNPTRSLSPEYDPAQLSWGSAHPAV
jgi:hypothetical protein